MAVASLAVLPHLLRKPVRHGCGAAKLPGITAARDAKQSHREQKKKDKKKIRLLRWYEMPLPRFGGCQ